MNSIGQRLFVPRRFRIRECRGGGQRQKEALEAIWQRNWKIASVCDARSRAGKKLPPDFSVPMLHTGEWTWKGYALEWFLLLTRVQCQFASMALRSLD